MKLYQLNRIATVHADLTRTWDFFSDPRNLRLLTPPDMSFLITDEAGLADRSHTGMLIAYKVKPLLGIPMNWLTEIKAVANEKYFIDEQRSGPYAFWYHEHYFETGAQTGTTLMRDRVTYALPLGILGRCVNSLLVANKLKHIFDYREAAIQRIFPAGV